MLRTYWMIAILLMIIPSFLGFLYGAVRISKKQKELYAVMGVCAVFCLFIAQLADLIVYLSGHNVDGSFHIGSLGTIGYFLFLMTANAVPAAETADIKNKSLRKYNVLAMLVPVVVVIVYGLCIKYLSTIYDDINVIPSLIMTVLTAIALYYSSKMIFIPCQKDSLQYNMRPYNIAIIFVGLFLTLERGLRDVWDVGNGNTLHEILMLSLYTMIGISLFVSVVLLKRGIDRWSKI